jgi:hypothetical protein
VNGWYATGQRRQFLPGGKLRRMGEHERRAERQHHKKCDETSNLKSQIGKIGRRNRRNFFLECEELILMVTDRCGSESHLRRHTS